MVAITKEGKCWQIISVYIYLPLERGYIMVKNSQKVHREPTCRIYLCFNSLILYFALQPLCMTLTIRGCSWHMNFG